MEKPLSDFFFKKMGKMISDQCYDLNERYAPRLLDLGFIKLIKWTEHIHHSLISCSCYTVTTKGKKAYREWKNSKTEEKNEPNKL